MNEISQIDLARLAAYIDGEGGITINSYFQNERNGSRRQHQRVVVQVSNSDIRLLDWCKSITGVGTVQFSNRRNKLFGERNWKPVYVWSCANTKAYEVVMAVHPYLIIKRERAEIVEAFQKLVLRGTNRRKGVPPENQTQRLQLVHDIRQLNRRGRGVA
jgi:hypothetical protein